MTEKKLNLYNAILRVREAASRPIVATAKNPMFRNKYATIKEIMDFLNPILTENKLMYTSRIVQQGEVWGVESELIWVGEDHLESMSCFFPAERIADAQKMGSLYTYARRYNLTAMLNLTFENDETEDDGNKATTPKTAPRRLDDPTRVPNF